MIESFTVQEEHPGPFPMVLGKIPSAKETNRIMSIRGPGSTEDPVGLLSLDNEKKTISINRPLDYEKHQLLQLVYESRFRGEVIDTHLRMEIIVLDINDNQPVFTKEIYTATLHESQTQGPVVKVHATDADKPGTENSTFTFRIVSVSPASEKVSFDIETNGPSGVITFRGCLNYQEEKSYTIIVEAKDHGSVVQLSSTSTVIVNVSDQNNHLPMVSGPVGPTKVQENRYGIEVGRIQVTDEDTQGTPAWRARYRLHGDPHGHFKIATDPVTNEGILTVEKVLDYEELSMRNLSITVENEEPLFCCDAGKEKCSTVASELQIGVEVVNENEPPVFDPLVKVVSREESIAVGSYLEQLTAKDPDNNTIQYLKGKDPAGWVSVDSKTGKITTAKNMDRESPYVRNNRYNVTIYAVDDEAVPLTGTGTLIIHLVDINDNAPTLEQSHINMCMSDKPAKARISATDKDEKHHSGPYHFEILNEVHGLWRLEPAYGETTNLIKEWAIYSSRHDLTLKVLDSQGLYSVSEITVHVIDCSRSSVYVPDLPTCQLSGVAITIMLLSLLLLSCILLLTANRKDVKHFAQLPGVSGSHLLKYHTEGKGEDTMTKLLEKVSSEELGDYEPRVYADEGGTCDTYQLDPIPVPELDDFDMNMEWDLHPKFTGLAAISRPDLFQTQSQLVHSECTGMSQYQSQVVHSQSIYLHST
ncbi:hypothetical protein ACEWY4_000502 [Coilia grayii]|uniref:Cadherin domain-containing protein n=1 Tax=Coilia grayii TaxID=363190 RepID=A0ABD1KWU9_9TELE